MFRSRAMEVGTDQEGDAGSPPLASKWWERIENCGTRQCTAPRSNSHETRPESPPPHPGSRAPAEPPRLAGAGSPRATCARSTRGPPRTPCRASHLGSPEHPPRLLKPPRRGSPCPAGGRTHTRSPARGSPGERLSGSILPGKPRARVRAGGGDRTPCGAQTRLLPRPPPGAIPAAHLPAPGQPLVPSPSSPAPSPAGVLCALLESTPSA